MSKRDQANARNMQHSCGFSRCLRSVLTNIRGAFEGIAYVLIHKCGGNFARSRLDLALTTAFFDGVIAPEKRVTRLSGSATHPRRLWRSGSPSAPARIRDNS